MKLFNTINKHYNNYILLIICLYFNLDLSDDASCTDTSITDPENLPKTKEPWYKDPEFILLLLVIAGSSAKTFLSQSQDDYTDNTTYFLALYNYINNCKRRDE